MPYHQSLNSKDDYHYNIWTYTDQSFTPHFHKNLELVFSEDFVRSFAEATHGKVGEAFGFQCPEPTQQFLLSRLIHKTPDTVFGFKSCLYAVCDEYFRQTPLTDKEFLNSYRLEYALRLLEENNQSITEIALESGFQSARNFNYFFRKSIGMSPTEYKKSYSSL